LISVKDRLPELHTVVALLNTDMYMITCFEQATNWYGAGYLCEFGGKYWSVFNAHRSQTLESVTHWKPLPEPPNRSI
jgi:hypothetical protein